MFGPGTPSPANAGGPFTLKTHPGVKKKWKPKRGAINNCNHSLHQVLSQYNHLNAGGVGGVSYATSRAREDILTQGFRILNESGYKIRNVRNFNTTHMRVLAKHWESKPLSASTLQLRFSVFRTFCEWIGKKGMVGDSANFLENPEVAKRTYVARKDKGWVTKGIDILPKIKEVFSKDKYVAIQLLVMWSFGLRAREAWQFHPLATDLQQNYVAIYWGTKGGRKRELPIRNPWQRQVVEMALRNVSATGSLIPSDYTRIQWQDHFYRVCRACGISRANGYVPHGLRHERANQLYEQLSGERSPVQGGAQVVDENLYEIDVATRLEVAKDLGHSRPQITGAYCGGKPRKNTKERQLLISE